MEHEYELSFPFSLLLLFFFVIPQLSFVSLWCVCTFFLLSYSLYLPVSRVHTLIHCVVHAHCHILKHFSFWSRPAICSLSSCLTPALSFLSAFFQFFTLHSWSVPHSMCPWLTYFLSALLLQLFKFFFFSNAVMGERCRGTLGPLSSSLLYPLSLPFLLLFHSSLSVSPSFKPVWGGRGGNYTDDIHDASSHGDCTVATQGTAKWLTISRREVHSLYKVHTRGTQRLNKCRVWGAYLGVTRINDRGHHGNEGKCQWSTMGTCLRLTLTEHRC